MWLFYLLENGVEADDDACEHLVGRHCWDAVCVMLRNGMISLPHKLFALAQGDDRLVRQLTRSLFSCSSHAYSAFAVDNMSLLRACEWGDAQVTELLLRRGVKASFYFLDKSPIHVVRTVECLQLLLAAKADVHAHTLDRETALHCACSVGQRNGVAGDDGVVVALVESRRRASPARRGRVCDDDVVVALIEAGARVNDTDAYGRTALYYAARCGCERAVEALLDAGARVNDLDTNGWSPFHFAAASGNQAVLRALVAAGAVVNARNADGCTPLDVCLQERFSCSTFLYLVDVGCVGSPATMNAALLRVIDIGAKTDVRSVALLLEHGADANARDDRGQSALSIVARGGCRSALLALLCNGALVSRCDQDGKSPLLHAIDNSRYACAVRLVAVGAAIGERESAALVGKDSRWAALAENAKTLDIGGELHRARDGKAALMHTTQNSGAFNLVASAAMRDTSVRYSEDDLLMRFDGAPTIDIGVALHRSRFCFLGLSELSILMQRVTAVRTKRVERNAFVQSLVSDVGSFVCGTGSFATWHAVVAAQAHFIKLETAYDALQERLRAFAASPLDLDVVVSERDNARVTLNAACAQLERCYSAFVANDGRKLTDKLVKSILERLKSLMASEPRYPLAESSDPLAVLTDWSERCTTQMGELRDETEAAACALQGALSRVGDVLSTPAASVYMPSSPTCATLSVAECCAAEEAFLDYCVDQRAARAAFRLAALLREFSAQVGAVEAANSRCRTLSYGWRERGTLELALTPPNADQYRVAMAAALESQETLLKARVQLGSEKKRVALKLHSDSAAAERYEAAAREATALWRSAQRAVEATVVELAQFVFDFPELLVRYGGTVVGLDSFVAAGGDRSVLRTLVEYEERRELVHGRLEAATFRGNPCALKLYQLDASGQARFLREARRLRLLAHANIVEVSAVFVDGSVGVIEMPLYVGDLWQWLALAERSVATRVGVLRQALCGLEHVHRASVVHGDIKPQNILIDGDGTARIGDFDVSQHDVTVLHTTVRGRGFTEAYLAPELVDGTTRASTASDIYAFGVTLLDVLGHERSIRRGRMTRELLASAIEQLAELHIGLPDLLTRLCAEAPRDRPSASEALLIGSFAPHRQPQEDDERLYRCVICCEDFRGSSEGWSCGGGHFYCSADLHGWVDFFCKLPPTEVARHMKLTCSVYECAASWTLTKLAAALQSSPELFSRYVDTLAGAAQCQAANALQVRHKAELDLQERLWRGELDRDEELRVHRRHIEERLLNLQCPRCSAVFGAFDGCFALTCSNCGASICAWCLFDGGADAHAHVFVCERNPRKGEDVFGTEADWEACQRQRRIALVRAYLDTRVRRPEMRAAVLDAVSGSLRNVAIEHVDCQQ
jgi:ankyrin repeat protein/serine/threonine protein kinase